MDTELLPPSEYSHNAAVNVGVRMPCQGPASHSFGYTFIIGIAGSPGNSIFKFFEGLPYWFP